MTLSPGPAYPWRTGSPVAIPAHFPRPDIRCAGGRGRGDGQPALFPAAPSVLTTATPDPRGWRTTATVGGRPPSSAMSREASCEPTSTTASPLGQGGTHGLRLTYVCLLDKPCCAGLGITAMVQRETQTSLSSSSVMRISQTWVVWPRAIGLATPLTHPDATGRMGLALISMPTQLAWSWSIVKIAAQLARVSASVTDAPPWRSPRGWRVRLSTGIRAIRESSPTPTNSMPRWPIRLRPESSLAVASEGTSFQMLRGDWRTSWAGSGALAVVVMNPG